MSNFAIAVRGYNKAQVDERVTELQQQLQQANEHLSALQQAYKDSSREADSQRQLITELQEQLETLGATGYTGLGLRVEKSLQMAEDIAQRLITQAEVDADKLRGQTEAETSRLLRSAQEQADHLIRTATEQADILTDAARNDAAELVSLSLTQIQSTSKL